MISKSKKDNRKKGKRRDHLLQQGKEENRYQKAPRKELSICLMKGQRHRLKGMRKR